MIARVARRLGLVPLLLCACAVLTAGCGGGGGPSHVFVGTLEVNNSPSSFEYIVDIEVEEFFGPYYAYFFDQNVLQGDSWFLDLYPSRYYVTLYWSDFYVETFAVDVFDGTTTTIFAFR